MHYRLCDGISHHLIERDVCLFNGNGDLAVLNEMAAYAVFLVLEGWDSLSIAHHIEEEYGREEGSLACLDDDLFGLLEQSGFLEVTCRAE